MQQEVVAPAPPLPDGANPGRAENAFIIYRRDKNTAYQLSCALRNLKAGEQKNVSKAIALMWHSEDPRVKEMYFQRARLAREVHRQMYPDYKFQPKRGPKPKGSKPKHHKRSVKKNFGPPGTTRSKTIDAEGYSELLFPPGPLATPAVTPTPPALSSASSSTLSSNGLPNELLPDLQSPSVASDGSEDAFFSFGEHELAMLTTPWMEDYAVRL
ncbi:hypothetical protein C8Q79DRAFT_232639 [Trametes meyenii]|nr:hypothetical protein C8Q79DRAFT_232639 [Trametes meyenii]